MSLLSLQPVSSCSRTPKPLFHVLGVVRAWEEKFEDRVYAEMKLFNNERCGAVRGVQILSGSDPSRWLLPQCAQNKHSSVCRCMGSRACGSRGVDFTSESRIRGYGVTSRQSGLQAKRALGEDPTEPFAPSSFLLLIVRPGATSSVLAPSS